MNLYVAHSSAEKIRCCFYTVVVRNERLAELFGGGLRAFVARYRAECNNQISVFCDMGSNELDDVIQDLITSGLKMGDDFALFNAADLALSESISMGRFKRPKMINLGLSWPGSGWFRPGTYRYRRQNDPEKPGRLLARSWARSRTHSG